MDRSKKTESNESKSIYRIPPYYYIHVLDQNSNVTKLEVGPQTFIRQDNEKVILGPEKMIVVPPRHYCIVENPAMIGKDGKVLMDGHGQVCNKHQKHIWRADMGECTGSLILLRHIACAIYPVTLLKLL